MAFILSSTLVVAQPYVNGTLSTGATSSNNIAAPAGFTWSEVQNPNTNAGFGASITNNFKVGDNFVVPPGLTWNISSMVFYGYQTGYAGATSPFTTVRVAIHSGSITGPIVFGDQTTNRFASSANSNVYRIFNATPGTTRIIWSITANTSVSLTAGTYWIEYATDVTGGANHFLPGKTVVGQATQPGNNAQQSNAGVWAPLTDAGGPQDMPFIINYTSGAAVPCSGTPAPGNTVSTITTGCAGVPFTLSPQNATTGTGVTYQYQSSPTGAAGTFTNIPLATNSSYSSTVTATTFYQVLVTCGGVTTASNPVQVSLNPPTQCYCASTATSVADEDIFNVTVGTLNSSSTCATTAPGPGSVRNLYSNYTSGTGAPAAPNLVQGLNQPFSVQIGTCGGPYGNSVAIFIDLNQDGDFIDAGERVYVSPAAITGPHTQTGNLIIPANATLGITRMRVINVETAPNFILPCGTYTWGETEDYNVNIIPCIPAAITAPPANTSAVCAGSTTFSVSTSGTIAGYQWQYRINATSPWITVPNAAPYSGVNTATLTITGANPSLNGYQYRVIVTGACTGADFSAPATLTITPIVATVTPTSAALCLGAVQALSITNISSPVPGSVTVNSTFTTPIAIPDAPSGSTIPYPAAVLAGINNTLNVTVPAGATVTGVRVRMSGSHPYFGDLVMTLKAPNNSVVNLNYFLNQTGGGVSTAYTNTVITSNTAAPALSTGTAAGQYTGTFRADLVGAAGTAAFGNQPGGPTAFLPTVTSFAPLFTPTTPANASGSWTLAIYDGGATDAGTLANWSIIIDYLLGTPATGVFTGPAGTMFTDAAATIPYTGTVVNTIYVKPTVVGVNNYSVTVTDAPCTSNPLTIPVTVNATIGGTATFSNTSICVGNNGFIKLGGTLTGGPNFVHTFQVKAPGATNFTNIPAGGVYSFSGDTLKFTNVPLSFNGYQFRDSVTTPGNCGNVISTVATLSVNPIPVVTIGAAPRRNLFPGLTTTLTAAVSGVTPPVTYQWFRNGVAVPGATNNTLVVSIDGRGTYTVVATAQGCPSTAATTTGSPIVIGDSVGVNTLFIYPSPNTGKFQVRYFFNTSSLTQLPAMVNVYDQKGARVFTRRYIVAGYQAMDVDLGAHGKGIYRVELTSDNGDRLKTGSVMVF